MVGRINIEKMALLPKVFCRFNTIFIKILVTVFIELDKIILKFIYEQNSPRIAEVAISRNSAGGLIMFLSQATP